MKGSSTILYPGNTPTFHSGKDQLLSTFFETNGKVNNDNSKGTPKQFVSEEDLLTRHLAWSPLSHLSKENEEDMASSKERQITHGFESRRRGVSHRNPAIEFSGKISNGSRSSSICIDLTRDSSDEEE
jgi:hypothetical protein